jgi:hypothetical protein
MVCSSKPLGTYLVWVPERRPAQHLRSYPGTTKFGQQQSERKTRGERFDILGPHTRSRIGPKASSGKLG